MVLKFIEAQINRQNKHPFHQGQAFWRELSRVPGFIYQMGGWNHYEPNTAIVAALWESIESHREFMRGAHDSIVNVSNQAKTIESIRVNFFDASPLSERERYALFEAPMILFNRVGITLQVQGRSETGLDDPSLSFRLRNLEGKSAKLIPHKTNPNDVVAYESRIVMRQEPDWRVRRQVEAAQGE
ncbi:MAG: DUF4937 domain-containing protein [Candidatus Eisenbacteria bacterium]|uniref:DUF4937 domain-containing protein n=1 Tax=Eiseniibacteriota bacterium TaxID=2212470 RepID=A0A7Y2E779_UNCEI|nr:DUF4937 domain-containing protein [Candidatus Eisenbacteria bacterium]